jgi:UDP-N-acetylmuramyl tripeptide synthase
MHPRRRSRLGSRGRIRRTIAIAAAQGSSYASRVAGRRATALPGLVAERIDPDILVELRRRVDPVVLVAGTNGKTTTTRLLARILETTGGRRPVSNRSGANLSQGIISALLAGASNSDHPAPAVFEVDELALSHVAPLLRPDAVVVLNLVRDQLDRYGEVDAVERGWSAAFEHLGARPTVVACADDPRVESIAGHLPGRVLRFGLEGTQPPADGLRDDAARSATGTGIQAPCPRCGGPTDVNDASVAGGAWRCRTCGAGRSPLDLGIRITGGDDRWLCLDFVQAIAGASHRSRPRAGRDELGSARIRLAGRAGAHDAGAAVLAAIALGLDARDAVRAINGATPAFGRLEELSVDGREVVLSLAKNPASAAQAAEAAEARRPDRLLIGLGDRPADGRDVSWIWDAGIDSLARLAPLTLTGERAHDLALRFKYGDSDHAGGRERPVVDPELEHALGDALARVEPGGTLMVLATYSTLLGIRRILERRGQAAPMPQ